ncbi:Uncharacterised protein [Chryseobacterium taklimakanense]|uniref:Uncharacterized protein n=1 Tax=Chryseobacterium taklimakanense TaxID=536441 RepID=A0A239WM28_9FLAO|nr:hypothetical protein [Chryseobacterium taklimakanense]SNV35150.1 Uncharacterised protein [Chryseobacterium taklimakanense]
MAKQIEFYNLDKEYPVNYEIWKDFAAFFLYTGYKIFSWKGGFKKHSYEVVRRVYYEANNKIEKGISFIDFETAKDRLYNNYSSFRYYFERAEKITSLDFKSKIDWTISEVYKNLSPRISLKNRLDIEYDFYKNCHDVLLCKIIIHYYAINHLNIEPKRLILDPLLLEDRISEENEPKKSEDNYNESEDISSSYLLTYDGILSLSNELRNMFINKELFDKIDFSKLKEYDIVYDSRKTNLELNFRYKTDLVIILILMKSKNIIQFANKKDMNKIFKECFGKEISETVFTNTEIKWATNKMNQNDSDAFKNANLFIDNYLLTL